MAKPDNRLQLMQRLGATQRNTLWSWCGVNESERKVYFSIWTDNLCPEAGKHCYYIQEEEWGMDDQSGRKKPARNDQDEKLALVFEHGYEPYGYFIEAVDRTAQPRKIAKTTTSFVVQLDLDKRSDGSIVGTVIKRIPV